MGSKLGWILAAFLVLGLVFFIVWQVFFPGHSPPEATLRAGMLELKTIDVPVSEVVGFTPDGGGNAGDDYAAAAQLAVEKRQDIAGARLAIQEAKDSPAPVSATARETLEQIASHVARGARKKEMKYLFRHTPKTLRVHIRVAALEDLAEVTAAMQILSDYYFSHKKYDEAETVLHHMLVMGRHMMDERSHIHMFSLGLGAQRAAWSGLARLYGHHKKDPERLRVLGRYRTGIVDLEEFYREKHQIVWNVRPHPGDIFNIIENDKDPAWRLQGVLALGMIKFSARKRGDHRYIKKLMNKLVGDSNEMIATAAKAARDLKIEEYRMTGGRR